MGLFSRFFLILLCFALIPALGVAAWFFRADIKTRENVRWAHRQIVLLAAETIESSLADMNRSLGFVTELERGPKGLSAFKILQRAATTYPRFVLLALFDGSGREVARFADMGLYPGGAGLRDPASGLLRSAAVSGEASIGPVTERGGLPVLPIAYPLRGGGRLYAEYSMSRPWERIARLSIGSGSRLLVAGPGGRPAFGFDGKLPEPGWRGPGPLSGDAGWLDDIPTAAGSMVGAYAKVRMSELAVLSIQPRAQAYAISDRARGQAAASLLMVCLAVAAGAFWLARRLTEPLLALAASARRVSQGDFKRPSPEMGWGELSLLARTFNEMMRTMGRYSEMQVDQQLNEKAKVEALVHTIPDGIVLASSDGDILYINASARSILGAGTTTVPSGLGIRAVLRIPAVCEAMETVQRDKKRSATTEFELGASGSRSAQVFLCRAVAVSREGRELGVLLLLRDVTAERDLDRMKQELFHAVVHDLRGPMGSIEGFTQVISTASGIPEKVLRYSNFVRYSCQKLNLLVSSILDLAKIESGRMALRPAPFSPEDLLGRLKPLYAIESEMKGVALRCETGAPPAGSLLCDKDLIERVVMNLVSNALKFTPRGGTITVRAAAAGGDRMEFSVSDTGQGIPADKLDLVFGRFKQLDRSGDSGRGYGLGLSVCKKIVELHGGRIWVESAPGKGSRFVFHLPLKPPPAPTSPSPAA